MYTPEVLDCKSGWDGKRTTIITPLRDKNLLRRLEIDRRFSKDHVPIEHYLTHRPADPRSPICRASRLQEASAFAQGDESETTQLQRSGETLRRVAHDLIVPTKPDIEGNLYAHTTIDVGTNYPKFLAIPNKTPEQTAK